MVKRLHRRGVWCAVALVCATGSAKADGILEQMQTEVASLADKMRSAVVTVQDEQGVLQEGSFLFLSTPLDDAMGRISKVDVEWKNLVNQKAALERKINSMKGTLKTEERSKAIEGLLNDQLILLQRMNDLKASKERYSGQLNTIRRDLYADKLGAKSDDNLFVQDSKRTSDNAPLSANLMAEAVQNKKALTQIQVFVSKTGTGFSIGDGYIVTTGDVALSLRQPIVITDNGTRLKARVVGSQPDLNIGLLRVTATTVLPSLTLGDSDTVKAGHFAVSMGNQAGQNNSVALMLVGNVRNEGTYAGRQFYPSLIQIAGTVGAGSSGAPLVNVKGEVIGMMAAIPVENGNWNADAIGGKQELLRNDTPSEPKGSRLLSDNNALAFFTSNQAVTSAGFAIPINQIKPIIDELRLEKPITRGWIGIAPEDVSRIVEKGNGIIDMEVTVRVVGVYPESPAMIAGVQPGDVLIKLDGKPVINASTIRQTSVRIRKGDTVALTLRRGKEMRTVNLKIEARPQTVKPPITVPAKEAD